MIEALKSDTIVERAGGTDPAETATSSRSLSIPDPQFLHPFIRGRGTSGFAFAAVLLDAGTALAFA